MRQYVWDSERMCYFSRGIGFYAEFTGLIIVGIVSVIFIVFLVRDFGLGVLIMLIPALVLWIPIYLSLWIFFSADWRWPRENLESIRRREHQAREKYLSELEFLRDKWK